MDKPQSDESDSMSGSDQDSDDGYVEEFEDCGRDERIGSESDTDDDEWLESVVEIEKVNKEDEKLQKELVECYLKGADEDVVNDLGYSSYKESEGDVNSPGESEEDDIRGKKYKQDVPVVDEQTDWNKWNWVVGTRFPSRDAFKEAVRKYAVTNGRNLSVSVSDKNRQGRVGVKCEKGCVFKLYLSLDESKGCYRVKTANNKHTCQRNMTRNRQLTSQFIANEFLPLFKAKPHWPAKEIQEDVKEKFKVLIETWMAYKAKRCAHMKLHGSMKEHYSKIGSYLEALRYANPTSTFELVTIPPKISNDVDVFKRIFVCFDGVKKGFMAGCRKILCLDGCFLKTFLKGMLLAAIGRDGNNQMYPLAWAVVEGENKDSWAWFLMELKICLALNDGGKGWTLIFDQQKV